MTTAEGLPVSTGDDASVDIPGRRAPRADRAPLSVLVTTFNEAGNIEDCLQSVQWADEIIVVDSFSDDDTVERSGPLADRILQHRYESPARQKNWGIPRTRHDWVLILDADERATREMESEVRALLTLGPDRDAYWIYRRNTVLGREVRHGGWQTDRVIRLFQRDRARYPDVRVHEEMQVDGPVGTLDARLMHHTFRSLAAYQKKMERYAGWWAEERAARGKRATAWNVASHTVARFLRMYVLRAGFLDGGPGLVLALMDSFSVFQKYARLWEMGRRPERPE